MSVLNYPLLGIEPPLEGVGATSGSYGEWRECFEGELLGVQANLKTPNYKINFLFISIVLIRSSIHMDTASVLYHPPTLG